MLFISTDVSPFPSFRSYAVSRNSKSRTGIYPSRTSSACRSDSCPPVFRTTDRTVSRRRPENCLYPDLPLHFLLTRNPPGQLWADTKLHEKRQRWEWPHHCLRLGVFYAEKPLFSIQKAPGL